MSPWSAYKAWRHAHPELAELINFTVEFFVALEVIIKLSEWLSKIAFSFLSYQIQINIRVGVLILLFIGLFALYYIIRTRVKKLRQKLTSAVNDFKDESTNSTADINVTVTTEIVYSSDPNITYPLKIYFNITNLNTKTVMIDKVIFSASKSIKIHFPNNIHIAGDDYQPTLYLGKVDNKEKWGNLAVMEPLGSIKFFIPIDKDFGQVALQNSFDNKTVGTVVLRATMLSNELVTRDLRFDF